MAINAVGPNAVKATPDTSTADAAAPHARAVAGSGGGAVRVAEPNALNSGGAAARVGAAKVAVADGFTPPSNPSVALPALGEGTPTSGAYQDLVQARAELRHAKNETPGNGHRRADIRAAKQDIRQAEAALDAQSAGGGVALDRADPANAIDAWGDPGAVGDAVDPGKPTVADQLTAIVKGGTPLAEGHELPEISQLDPKGNSGKYHNGEMNCAPAALAMIAVGKDATLDGRPVSSYSEAELINRIGDYAGTDKEGTTPNGVIAAAQEMGFQTDAIHGGLDRSFYDQVLQQGGSVIANGGYEMEGGQPFGHFVTVAGKTEDGKYVINDPLQGRLEWSPWQLNAFLQGNPTNGGISIGVW